MTVIEAIILGIIQGLTEFIPVSSSGHLVIAERLFNIPSSLAFDVALHIGTFLALVIYFNHEIVLLIRGLLGKNEYTRLSRLIALATIPAVIFGVLLESRAETTFRSVRLVAINLMLVAVLMLVAEKLSQKRKTKTDLDKTTLKQAMIVGIAQAAALLPGISRSGSTITAGLFAGLDRVAATRFAFLLAIPITFGAIVKVLVSSDSSKLGSETGLFIVGIMTAFIGGLFAIKFLLGYLAKHSLAIFAYYRLTVGALILLVAWLT